jgi:Fe-S oxidoreductase
VLVHDTFVTYFEPGIGQAATQVLEAAGYRVRLADGRKCCGRPMLSEGMEDKARAAAEHNVRLLAPIARQGTPIVGLEPSCILTIRKDYPALLGTDDAKAVANAALTFEEFVAQESDAGRFTLPPVKAPADILLHGHCHQKTLVGTGPAIEALTLTGAGQVAEIPSTCCGMAGSNGYECEHYERSLEAAEVTLLPAVRAASEATEIVAAGVSCRQQIKSGTGRVARHPAEVLYNALVADGAPGGDA